MHSPIDLPPVVLLHAAGLTLYGSRIVLKSSTARSATASDDGNGTATREVTTTTTDDDDDDDGLKGLLLLGIGLSYIVTGAYLPAAQNAWLYASVPLRLLLAASAGARLCLVRGLPRRARADMWMLVLGDGVMGVVAGWQLGRFDGKLPGW